MSATTSTPPDDIRLAGTSDHEIIKEPDGKYSVRALPSKCLIFGPTSGIQGLAECAIHIADTETADDNPSTNDATRIEVAIVEIESASRARRDVLLRSLADQLMVSVHGAINSFKKS